MTIYRSYLIYFQYEHVNVERIGEGEDAHDEETVFTIKVSGLLLNWFIHKKKLRKKNA